MSDHTRHTLPFGKYTGADVCTLVDIDRNYAFWIMTNVWFKSKYPGLHSALVRSLAKRLTGEVAEEDQYAAAAAAPRVPDRFKPLQAADFCNAVDAAERARRASSKLVADDCADLV